VVSWYLCGILACLRHVGDIVQRTAARVFQDLFFLSFFSHTHAHTHGIITRSESRDPLVCIPCAILADKHTHTHTYTHTV
jgi:hypothetical protein